MIAQELMQEELINEPSEIQVNIVKTTDELSRLSKIEAYEQKHNVTIL